MTLIIAGVGTVLANVRCTWARTRELSLTDACRTRDSGRAKEITETFVRKRLFPRATSYYYS